MASPQDRQRPRSSSQDRTGMLSRGAIGVPQLGQALGGWAIDSPRGTRWITTLANEPKIRPRTPQAAASTRLLQVGQQAGGLDGALRRLPALIAHLPAG